LIGILLIFETSDIAENVIHDELSNFLLLVSGLINLSDCLDNLLELAHHHHMLHGVSQL
jgi:hypothetical protein